MLDVYKEKSVGKLNQGWNHGDGCQIAGNLQLQLVNRMLCTDWRFAASDLLHAQVCLCGGGAKGQGSHTMETVLHANVFWVFFGFHIRSPSSIALCFQLL